MQWRVTVLIFNINSMVLLVIGIRLQFDQPCNEFGITLNIAQTIDKFVKVKTDALKAALFRRPDFERGQHRSGL